MSLNPLVWLETLVSWVLVSFHSLTSSVFDSDGGWAWGLAIVLLVVLIRIILIPLFVKQIKSQRNLQIIQPQVKEIQKKIQNLTLEPVIIETKGDKDKLTALSDVVNTDFFTFE